MGERPSPPRIFTDSTASLPPELARINGIGIVAAAVIFSKEREYRDGVNLSMNGLLGIMEKEQIIPTTSTPSPGEYLQAWNQYPDEQILSIHLIGKASKIYETAEVASHFPEAEGRVTAYDSESISGGLALMALSAAALSRDGKTIDEIKIELDAMKKKTIVFAAIDSLEHLERGGRISKGEAIFGSMLTIKPMITFIDNSYGVTEKPRTRRGSLRRLVELTETFSREHDGLKQVAVTHGGAEEDALQVMEGIKAKKLFQGTFLFGECGAVLVVQAGPRVVSVALEGNK